MPNNKKLGNTARERIRAITGEPTTSVLAVEAMHELVAAMHEEHLRRAEAKKQFRRTVQPFVKDLLKGIHHPNIRTELKSRALAINSPRRPRQPIESAILLGSIEAVFAPPYDYQWTDGYGGNHGEWDNDHDQASLQEMRADKERGDISVRNKAIREDFNNAYAGLGVYYRPLTRGFKRFRFGAYWDYFWEDQSVILTANNDGWIRLTIFERNLDGSDRHIVVNQAVSHEWSNGTSAWDGLGIGSGEALAGGFESMPFLASPDKGYELWAWIGTEVQSDDEDSLGGTSIAQASLQMHIPAMSIKEA